MGWGARRCQANEFNERGQLFMTPLIQAMRTIVHLGETVPEVEQARRPRRPAGLAVCRPGGPAASELLKAAMNVFV